MNTITIKFGQGTAAWKDMQEVLKSLQKKGYTVQPYKKIGTVKLTKEINMEEILVQGNITEDLKRLGVNATRTYGDETTSYQVYEVSDEDFKILSDDASKRDTDDGHWESGGWRWCEGSNQGKPNDILLVNNKDLHCWAEPVEDDQEEKPYFNEYIHLLEYLEMEKGCSSFKNVCALAKDLAKYNNMTMAELFRKYQGWDK
ncbi:hypothetical protein BCJMU07_4284 [Bacillus cereus]|nr:hypothetical protein BCJMU07_4284 [Bacillus cereus]BCC78696.1 hypothetical protein BCJMU62_4387 [Bacillus cereus]